MTTGPDLNEALPVDTSGVGEADDVLSALGGVERRLHARAYHHWASLLSDAPYPPIAALDPEAIADFAGNSVLLDFRGRSGDPAIAYIGQALRGEGDLDGRPGTLAGIVGRGARAAPASRARRSRAARPCRVRHRRGGRKPGRPGRAGDAGWPDRRLGIGRR